MPRYIVSTVRTYGVYTSSNHDGAHAERSAMLDAESKALQENSDSGHIVVLAVENVNERIAIKSIAQFENGTGRRIQ